MLDLNESEAARARIVVDDGPDEGPDALHAIQRAFSANPPAQAGQAEARLGGESHPARVARTSGRSRRARAFDASAEFDHDPLATAEEIQDSGVSMPRWLEEVASSKSPWPVDFKLIQEIHFRWFETTFPADAGQFRTEMVLNRKGTAVEIEAILPAVQAACENWQSAH